MRKTGRVLAIGGILAVVSGALVCWAEAGKPARKKVLLYSQSCGYRHAVVARPLCGDICHVEKILKKLLPEAGYEFYMTQDFNDLQGDQYKSFDAIIFYTTGDPPIHRDNLMKWVENGGAFIGVHCATDTFKEWEPYRNMVGGAFAGHGGNEEDVIIVKDDPDHPSTRVLPDRWVINDEIYKLKDFSYDNVHMLLHVDTTDMTDRQLEHHQMERGKPYPIAYTNKVGKGRVFYTSLGHREDVWTDELFQKHLLGGLAWALERSE